MVEPGGKGVELRLPVFAVAIEPQRGLEDRAGFEPAAADPAGALLRDEAGPDQDLDVARHGLQRDIERRGQFRDEQILAIEPRQHRAPDGVGERGKDTVEQHLRAIERVYGFCRNHAGENYKQHG